ncbi:glutathione S-transferase [Sphingorhabdus profundilacus]|uniref:glutathione S-transferase n=1 Tax=Sphingorhabdus profundilacus TaxID=2509718 RepID=UPI002483991A|nr:glutathione S-transferase [Sphingorhabdus profundilacus]
MPILYSFRRCPYAMRARMAVAVSGMNVELREVVLRDKPPELLAISSKATVPVLVKNDGEIIDESLDIMRWALAQNDPEGWLSVIDEDLISANDGPFKQALDRYKYPHRFGLADGLDSREEALVHVQRLNQILSEKPYLGGRTASLTDIAIFPFIRQFAATDRIWFDGHPLDGIKKWLGELVNSTLFDTMMRRYPQWNASSPLTYFP